MSDDPATIKEAKARAAAQFGATAAHYVASRSHAAGDDLPRMVELTAPRPADRLLDIATGGGNVARVFAPLVAEVVASDLTPAMLAATEAAFRAHGFGAVSFAEADAEDLPFADASFEIVTCRIAPHHFPQPDRFVREAARVLVPGGRFVLVDSTVPEGDVGQFWNRLERVRDGSHVRSLTSPEWSGLIRDAGLTLEAVEDYPKRHVFEDWVARAEVPAGGREELSMMLRQAPPSVRDAFAIEFDAERVVAFTDVKTLFFATKAP